jgi:hypothetical protein
MFAGQTIFTQLMEFLPKYEFRKCVQRYDGDYRVHSFSCLDQFFCMSFAQLTGRESLRDIETCLRAMEPKLYHSGFRCAISRTTLADANERRDWRIYADFAQVLIRSARLLYAYDTFGVELDQTAYALDSTIIDLCLSLFPWARYQQCHGAVKLHTLIDLRGNIPCWIRISNGKLHDVNVLDELTLEPGAFYIMDRGYIDFQRLAAFLDYSAYFIIRAKCNLRYRRRSYREIDRATGLRSDQTIVMRNPKSLEKYPHPLRYVSFWDADNARRLVFLSNNFPLPALTIAQLYKCRWQVELFFRWIKQNLRIKAFYGTSENAVKTQIWISISIYVLLAILKKQLGLRLSLSEIQQVLSIAIFEQVPMYQVLTETQPQQQSVGSCNQLSLWNL